MKHTIKKLSAFILAIVMCMSLSANAFATETNLAEETSYYSDLANVVFQPSGGDSVLASSGSKNVTTSYKADKFGVIVLPKSHADASGSVKIKVYYSSLVQKEVNVPTDGNYHQYNIPFGAKGTFTVSYSNPTKQIISISLTLGS